MSIWKKIGELKAAVHSAPLKKSGRNEFAKYSYFELGDFVPFAVKKMAELKLASVVTFDHDTATMKVVDTETGEVELIQTPVAEAALKGCHPVQNLGAQQTYLRRYLWVSFLDIVENDLIDSSEPVKQPEKPQEPELSHEEMVNKVIDAIEATGTDTEKFLQFFKVADPQELSPADAKRALAMLSKKKKGAKNVSKAA